IWMGLCWRSDRRSFHREPTACLPVPIRAIRGRQRVLGRIHQESLQELGTHGPPRSSRTGHGVGRVSSLRNPDVVFELDLINTFGRSKRTQHALGPNVPDTLPYVDSSLDTDRQSHRCHALRRREDERKGRLSRGLLRRNPQHRHLEQPAELPALALHKRRGCRQS
ncbi:hypothetical protein LTR16_009558, partial [Cryomyces antarcticus]